ncbi:site-specific DNA-methyltransferase [Helicobacter pylori]|uniref:site-specific DNA-methyltransferase n=1 Tax=Helicobacter pylori TaxID=210 RepID=UPI0002BA58F6|nr:site-specific DNA-methyltransferase [Helicobacter pylori]EMH33466.1 DNA (cytosine-5-)-methyltransferase [Helicobacter pylori GAM42Ai]
MQNKEICEEKSVNEKNLEVFNRYFPGCLSIENDNQLTLDTRKLKALLGDFSEMKEEGYGLDFVGKKIALNQAFKKNHKILKPLNESTSKHILIKGDNLDALKILKQSYSEKIKTIYIDPPYNTKNENFIYGDDFSQSNEEVLKTLDYSKEKLDYIKNLFGLKSHSGWLSFMYPRLLLARDLLKQDGVIFISIDDNEAAQLKLLCDEIFGEGNFVACAVWHKKDNASFLGKDIIDLLEYVLIYKKSVSFKGTRDCLIDTEKHRELITKSSKIGERIFKKDCCLIENGDFTGLLEKGLYGSKQFCMEILEDVEIICGIPKNDIKIKGRFCWTQSSLDNETLKGGRIEIKSIKGMKPIFYKNFDSNIPFRPMRNLLSKKIENDVATYNDAANEIKEIFDNLPLFEYSKPSKLIKKFIRNVTDINSNDIILDFFAGSGTTAHAVLESNKSDYQKLSEGGGLFNGLNVAFKERRFILVQLDEKIDPNKNKSAHDFCLNTLNSTSPSIFDITQERIKRAGAKIKEACPNLDVGFRAFEIVDDGTHANDKNLSQAKQEDLFAYSNPEKMETQTILIKLLGCEGLELTTPIICLIENALYLAQNTAFIVGDIEMSEVLENLKDKGVEKISMYMPAISNDRLCLELGSNLFDLKLESGDLKIRG